MASELEWFPCYANRWLLSQGVRLMTFEQRGIYWELLCMEWRDGSIPADLEDLAALLHVPLDQLENAWRRIGKMFAPAPGNPDRLQNEWLEDIRAEQIAKRERKAAAGTKGAASRWSQPSAPLEVVDGGKTEDEPKAKPKPEPKPKATNDEAAASGPYAQVEQVLTIVQKSIPGWPAPVRNDVLKGLGRNGDGHIMQLVKQYGVEVAAHLFVHAQRTWSKPPTWPSVFTQRGQLHSQLKPAGITSEEAQELTDEQLRMVARG
jgi:hypothetical protein